MDSSKNAILLRLIEEGDCIELKNFLDNCIEYENDIDFDRRPLFGYPQFNYDCFIASAENNDGLIDDSHDRNIKNEVKEILSIYKNSDLKPLLAHPVVSSFLYKKWSSVCLLYTLNFIFYILFSLFLCLHINNTSNGIFNFLCKLFTSLMILRESVLLVWTFQSYIKNFENYLKIFFIISLLALFSTNLTDVESMKQLISVIILLGSFQFIFIMGKYPVMSVNIIMFRTVSFNFLKFFSFYFFIIIAFAVCFHKLFGEDSDNSFKNYLQAFFKTIIMLTGEFDSTAIQFDRHPIISHGIFVTFILFAVIVLLNLINGLAVNDIQKIRKQAKLNSLIALTELLYNIEALYINVNECKWMRSALNYLDNMRILSCMKKYICSFSLSSRNHEQVNLIQQVMVPKTTGDIRVAKKILHMRAEEEQQQGDKLLKEIRKIVRSELDLYFRK
ncbi:PREDICTED: transient receptor potential cation channel protein painless-like [Nicrophorus vespilloides]|uniref:Transient receptor potential cation channel protein painless-like n=1 Tax=Nicrophorus vespilloides TaxID=110193 RepID=A0ABM1MMU5_NICVS|nr:PREDICTED: transient receptor potential cation channel protein painless-like [Nicrophorus vespilloides]